MTDLRFHAILFGAVLIATYFTWSRDVSYGGDDNTVRIWDRDSTEVLALGYRIGDTEIRIERRSDQAGGYLWGIETVGADAPVTSEFPVGSLGNNLLDRIAGLRTVRDLGPLSAEMMSTFGIAGASDRLTVEFGDEQRELVLGGEVYGSEQRYAYEPATGVGHVLPRDVVTTMTNGRGAIRERWVNRFPAEELARVRVQVDGTVRTMSRLADTGEWADPGNPAPDIAFGTFMQRVNELAIEGFAARPGPGARVLVRVEYLDGDDELLGFMELLRDDSQEADPYFIVSETTRVPARAMTFLAELVEQGLAGALSGAVRGPAGLSSS